VTTEALLDAPSPGALLHVGCGYSPLPDFLTIHNYVETRLDIDPRCEPDVVASMTDLGDIGAFDLVFSHHSLEHLAPHDVGVALKEFQRVLTPSGAAIVFVPDLEGVAPTDDVLFVSPAGPIAGLDLFYGLRAALIDQPYMAHQTGFVSDTLRSALEAAGFARVVIERLPDHNLLAIGYVQ
jgi:SAM-dependent methyltransferase